MPAILVKWLIQRAKAGAFDGEIMVSGTSRVGDVESDRLFLESFGYRGPEKISKSEYDNSAKDVDFAIYIGGDKRIIPNWLDHVEVRFLDEDRTIDAWKLRNSDIFQLYYYPRNSAPLETKGYEVDWPPFIGKILS
jgi:hypothetical protein